MKKIISLLLTILLLLLLSQPAAASEAGHSPNMRVHSEIVYLFNLDEQTLVYQRGADTPAYPASLAKIMTTILAIENTPDLGTIVTYPQYVQDYLFNYQTRYSVSVSLGGLRAGQQMPMYDLLYGMMLQSANEIAMIVAHHVGGGQEAFVQMMNDRARQLGATNTNFTNATGLPDPQMVTTARDMAIIVQHAMSLPGFMDIASTARHLDWSTTILMQVYGNQHFYPQLRGIKTGTTPQAGRNFISTASRDGFTYLLILMGAPSHDPETGLFLPSNYAFIDAANLYNWAFDTFRVLPVVERGMRIHEIPLRLSSQQDFLPLETADRVSALIARGINVADELVWVYDVPESINAPVRRGTPIGYVTLMLHDQEIGRVALLAAENVDSSRMLVFMDQLRGALGSFWFRFAVIFIVLLITMYILLLLHLNRNKRRRSEYKRRRRI